MTRCSKCRRPLTEFEVSFHQHAHLNEENQNQCRYCLKISKYFYKPTGFSRYIKTCLIGMLVALIGVGCHTLCEFFMYASSHTVSDSLYGILIHLRDLSVVVIIGSGLKPALEILYPKNPIFSDPEEEHITSSYWTSRHHEGTFSDDGKTLNIREVTDTHSSSTNNWIRPQTAKIDRCLDGCIFEGIGKPILVLILSISFALWCIPYLITMIIMSLTYHTYQKSKIPHAFSEAYNISYKQVQNAPITFEEKVEFLKAKEEQLKKAQTSSTPKSLFDKSYNTSTVPQQPPYRIVKFNKFNCMIVDYVKHSDYGVTFVLVKNAQGEFDKKMVISGSFVAATPDNWEQDWIDAGAHEEVINNIQTYQNIFSNI